MPPLFAITLLLAAAAPQSAPPWEKIIEEDGITVWKRDVPGSSFVEFLARGSIESPMIRAAAVLRNSGREREWMESCIESRVLEWTSPLDATIYNRTESPVFFVSDRDLVAQARTTIDYEQKSINIEFKSVQHSRAPLSDSAVRMDARGHWKLRQIDARHTEIEYQLRADPGGALPAWIVNWASERIPFNTIVKMREQVKKQGYDKDEEILEVVIDFGRFGHEQASR